MTSTIDTEPEVDTRRAAHVDGVRALLDQLDANPDLPLPTNLGRSEYSRLSIPIGYGGDLTDDEVKALVVQVARTLLVGKWEKHYDTGDYGCLRIYGETAAGVHVQIYAPRDQVCTRVVTGTETVEVPDPAAVEALPKVPTTRDIVEWRCEPLLAAEASA